MVVVGQLLFCVACTIMCEARTFAVLLFSFMLYTLTATISGAPCASHAAAVPNKPRWESGGGKRSAASERASAGPR